MRRVSMVLGIISMFGLLLGEAMSPVHAQTISRLPFKLYDNFPDESISPDKWVTQFNGISGLYEVIREVSNGQLLTGLRTYGRTQKGVGERISTHRVRFIQSRFIAVKFDATVLDYEVIGCSAFADVPPPPEEVSPSAEDVPLAEDLPSLKEMVSTVRLVFLASLFSDGSSTGPGDDTGNVKARIEIFRDSDSLDPAGVFNAQGLLLRCTDRTCATSEVTAALLGPVIVGQPYTFSMMWDLLHSQVLFQKNAEPEVAIPYSQAVVKRHTSRQLATQGIAKNCTTGQTVASINAVYDNIMVFFAPF